MLLVMDESGDPGLNIPPGQNPWLVVGGVWFATREDATACAAALADLRSRYGGGEFHFAHSTPRRRHLVLDCLAGTSFRYYAVACEKTRLDQRRWRKPAHVRAEVSRRCITLVAPVLVGCSVWFDTIGGRDVDRAHGMHLRLAAGSRADGTARIRDFKALDSEREVLIQVADYICGAVSRSLRTDDSDADYRRRIAHREARVEVWPV